MIDFVFLSNPGPGGWEYHGDPPADIPGLEIVAAGTALAARAAAELDGDDLSRPKKQLRFTRQRFLGARPGSPPGTHCRVALDAPRP